MKNFDFVIEIWLVLLVVVIFCVGFSLPSRTEIARDIKACMQTKEKQYATKIEFK